MKISVFLSYPKPFNDAQKAFIKRIGRYLEGRGLQPRTIGVTDYDSDAPLTTIRRVMIESNGLLTVAFRRASIKKGTAQVRTKNREEMKEASLDGKWLTTPWAHIEPSMAFQIGLPILILREGGVVADGILEPGVVGLYLPEFNLDKSSEDYLASAEWKAIIGKWEGQVRAVVEKKGAPPRLF